MTTPVTRRVVGLAASALALALLGTAPAAVAATPGHAKAVTSGDFADPGFAKFGSYYYLYKTGPQFGVRTSASPASGYGPAAASMPGKPAWVAGSPKMWAPDVFASSSGGRPLFVMYFTAVKAGTSTHCIGVATSRTPDRNFVGQSKPLLCAATKGWETIDPSAYQAADGKRYLLYKLDYRNEENPNRKVNFEIRAVEMNPTGTGRTTTATRRKIGAHLRMEAPSAISHGGKVWLFTSRGNYADCSYSTEVWVADTLWNGHFTRVRTLMNRKSTGLCGPGGATVLKDGATTRIAFHAYVDKNKNGVKDNNTRRTWVGVVKWNSAGKPYLG